MGKLLEPSYSCRTVWGKPSQIKILSIAWRNNIIYLFKFVIGIWPDMLLDAACMTKFQGQLYKRALNSKKINFLIPCTEKLFYDCNK